VSPATHFLAGWLLANTASFSRRERAIVTCAGVIPDVDGLGIIPEALTRNSTHPLLWFSQYHHALHTLLFALMVAAASFLLTKQRWKTALLAFLAFHLHLFCDLIGARGPDGFQWPIPYLRPFSNAAQLTWHGQWALNAWPNFVITIALLLATLWLAWKYGRSPVELVAPRTDAEVVSAVRARAKAGLL
jgi:LexA-binding, inner membrane-associated putative hydrolase